jgi:hypothetical protein
VSERVSIEVIEHDGTHEEPHHRQGPFLGDEVDTVAVATETAS